VICFTVAAAAATASPAAQASWLDTYKETARRLIGAASGSTFAWERPAELTDTFGNRLSGSENLDAAIKWAASEMRRDGLENVRPDPVKVPDRLK
jgi:carboxypeptidase Q